MNPIEILNHLAKFALEQHGQNINGIVRGFIRKNPKLVKPGSPEAPPDPDLTRSEIDDLIDEEIESGEL